MKTYIGTKQIKAKPCSLGEFIEKYGRNPYQNANEIHEANEPGYLVEYEDGYQSWSPKNTFDKAYKCADTFLDRMHIEYDELFKKYDAIVNFIESGKVDEVIKDKYQNFLLRLQREIMSKYITTLECRIGCIDGAPNAPFNHMTFSVALEALKMGFIVRRQGWNGKGIYVFRQVPAFITSEIIPKMQSLPESAKEFILKHSKNIHYKSQCLIYNEMTGEANSWVPSISDVFADDWEVIF